MLSGPHKLPKTQQTTQKLVVFLHGYGSNGQDLIDLANFWADALPDAEFIAPNAIEPCEIFPAGYQWFSLQDRTLSTIQAGLGKAAPLVAEAIQHWLAARSLTPENLILVGFSQGAMLALELMYHIPGIRCILGYSGAFFPSPEKSLPSPAPNIFLGHGDRDTVIPFSEFQRSVHQLSVLNITPQTHVSHGIEHTIDEKAIRAGESFMLDCFATPRSVAHT